MVSLTRLITEVQKKIIKKTETKNYKVDDYKNPPAKDIKAWRTVKDIDKNGKPFLKKFAILKNGMTKLTSLWHSKNK